MEKKLRETLNKALDTLFERTLEKHYHQIKKSKILSHVKSPRDFLLGVIIGDMFEGLGFCTYGAYKRYPKDREFDELLKIIQERSGEIREKIKQVLHQ